MSEFDPGGKGLPVEGLPLVLDVAMPVSTIHIHSGFDLLCAVTKGPSILCIDSGFPQVLTFVQDSELKALS